jgi:HEAT repeat protein
VALGAIGSEGIPALVELLQDEEESVVEAAAEALENIGPEAIPALVKVVRSSGKVLSPQEPREKYQQAGRCLEGCIRILEQMGPNAVPALTELLQDKNKWVRLYAAKAMVRMDTSPAAAQTALTELLEDKDIEVRLLSAMFLEVVAEVTIPDLIAALKSNNKNIQEIAASDLKMRLDPILEVRDENKSAIPALTELLEDKDGWVRFYAAQVMRTISPEAADAVLRQLLHDNDPGVRHMAKQAREKERRMAAERKTSVKTVTKTERKTSAKTVTKTAL